MLRVLLAITVVPTLCLVGWLAVSTRTPRAEFVVASDELRTIDPHRVSFMDEIMVAQALFEGLTRLNPETLTPEPAVAESMPEISADGTTYVFRLRANLRWSNGRPITAEHFRWSWLRVLEPSVAAQYASLLFVVDGARAYYDARRGGRMPSHETVGIEALDERTLRVRLAGPCSYFLDLTTFPTLAPVYPPAITRAADETGRGEDVADHRWTKPENIVCNGLFVLKQRDFKQRLLLERNREHWEYPEYRELRRAESGASAARPLRMPVDSIEVFMASTPAAALIAYETGRIDLVRGVEPEVARVLKQQSERGQRADFNVSPLFATFFLRVNCTREPFDDPELRKALSLAIDREAICSHVLGLGETPADTHVPRTAGGEMPREAPDGETVYYDPPDGLGTIRLLGNRIPMPYGERIKLARKHLDTSRYVTRARPIELLYASDPPQQRKIVEAVQAMWESALGVRVELRVMERKVLSERIRQLDYDVVRSDWYGDYMDPSTFLDMFASDSGQNRTGWRNERYDQLIAAATITADNRRRFDLLRDAERVLCEEELPILPIYHKCGNFLLNPRFEGLAGNSRDLLLIARVGFRRDAAIRAASTTP
jgi:oligopeptide transport system substrate-binding protein